MKLRLLVDLPEYGVSAGEETDKFADFFARRLLARGVAVLAETRPMERAVKGPVEKRKRK